MVTFAEAISTQNCPAAALLQMLIPNTNFIAFKKCIQISLGKFCQQNAFIEQKSAIKMLKTKQREKERVLPSCFNKIFIYDRQTKEKKK